MNVLTRRSESNGFCDPQRSDAISKTIKASMNDFQITGQYPVDADAGGANVVDSIAPEAAPAVDRVRRGGKARQFKREKYDVHGWLVLDKPVGMTSTYAVSVIKRLFAAKRA